MTTPEDLQRSLNSAVASGQVPYVVAMVGNTAGMLWHGTAGRCVVDGPEASLNTVFRIVSMSKAIGSTAALILADRGILDWDMPVDEVLPEFGELRILDAYGAAGASLRVPSKRATLRHLASHTSGLAYEFWDEELGRYLQDTGTPSIVSGRRAGLNYPLRFDPGNRWQYGGGIDWLGMAVAALDGRRIDQFCREEIFIPLGMSSTEFELSDSLHSRLGQVFARSEDSFVGAPLDLDPPSSPEFYGMGHALYSTAPDYLRFLRMWLGYGQLDGVRILKHNTVVDALRNQIGDLRLEARRSAFPPATADLDILHDIEKTHGLAFARVEQDVPGRRAVGSQFWGGVLNTHFWLDPKNDRAGLFMTQALPFLDASIMEAFANFEISAYALESP